MSDDYQIRGLVTGLTPAEKTFLVTHPHLVNTIKANADIALAEAARRYGGLHNGRGDAFRHCYWSALLARDIGGDNAAKFTGAHEQWSGNPPGEKAMDLHNNAVGIAIGRGSPGASNAALATRCVKAMSSGRLQTMP
ncbi:MAG: hypothetical protein K0V04_21310 [Deltaproteobacteria bacterium]|nr:hypothetical protein [Deltaproteobacteria bacterium]